MSGAIQRRWTAIARGTRLAREARRPLSTATPGRGQRAPATSSAAAEKPTSTTKEHPSRGTTKLSATALYFQHQGARSQPKGGSSAPSSESLTLAPPTAAALTAARTFFARPGARAVPYFTASALHQVPLTSNLPEVAFLGRSNAGKSTLLNAMFAAAGLCRTSSKPGRTRALHAYACGGFDDATNSPGFVAVLDMPGYGAGSRADWGQAVSRYLAARRQLRRAYVLVDAVHGLKTTDELMLEHLRNAGVVTQLVLAKVDRLLDPDGRSPSRDWAEGEVADALQRVESTVDAARFVARPSGTRGVLAMEEVLCVAAEPSRRVKLISHETGGRLGVDALRWSVLQATGFAGLQRKRTAPSDVKIDEER